MFKIKVDKIVNICIIFITEAKFNIKDVFHKQVEKWLKTVLILFYEKLEKGRSNVLLVFGFSWNKIFGGGYGKKIVEIRKIRRTRHKIPRPIFFFFIFSWKLVIFFNYFLTSYQTDHRTPSFWHHRGYSLSHNFPPPLLYLIQ